MPKKNEQVNAYGELISSIGLFSGCDLDLLDIQPSEIGEYVQQQGPTCSYRVMMMMMMMSFQLNP